MVHGDGSIRDRRDALFWYDVLGGSCTCNAGYEVIVGEFDAFGESFEIERLVSE